jgi:chromosome segregation ATPase
MSHHHESHELASAISVIRELTAAKAEAEAQIANCLRSLASEKAMLDSLLAEPETLANKEYLKVAKKACRLGVKAWNSSIAAYKNDIDTHKAEIDAILKRIPEARLDH